jgi:hypothetical protein
MRIDSNKSETNGVLAFRLLQPPNGVVVVTKQAVDDCYLISGYPGLVSFCQQLVENCARLFKLSGSGQHVRTFCLGRWSFAGKAALLFKRGERFVMHSFSFKGPAQDCVRRN